MGPVMLVFSSVLVATLAAVPSFGRRQGQHSVLSDSADIDHYYKLALELAQLDAEIGLQKLLEDPFGVKDPANFKCTPAADHPTERPNIMDIEGSFILYQHISKSGGTSFCKMARGHIPKRESLANCEGPKNEAGQGMLIKDSGGPQKTQVKPLAFMEAAREQNLRIHGNEWEALPT
jgi:hypothetical protein